MAKTYCHSYFDVKLSNGETLGLHCWKTPSRYYACVRHCECVSLGLETRETIYNYPWECFEYETVIKTLCNKMRRNGCTAYAKEIEKWCYDKEKEEHEKAEAFVKRFEKAHSGLTDEQKDTLANSDIMVETEEQAEALTGALEVMSILNKL